MVRRAGSQLAAKAVARIAVSTAASASIGSVSGAPPALLPVGTAAADARDAFQDFIKLGVADYNHTILSIRLRTLAARIQFDR